MRITFPQPTGLVTFCDPDSAVIFIEPNVGKAEELLQHVKEDGELTIIHKPVKMQSYVICSETAASITDLYKRYLDPSIDQLDPTFEKNITDTLAAYNQKNRRKKDR